MLKEIKEIPDSSGVYLMKDDQGRTIYIGKASSLKKRVKSYFGKGAVPAKTAALVSQVASIDYILTDSELEALILEASLIKQQKPRYNVNLKDDKSYPLLKVTLGEKYPRLFITRHFKEDGSRYFGPYANVGALYSTMRLLARIFPLRKCRKPGKNPCLYFHLGQCLGPCHEKVDKEVYQQMVKGVLNFLEGKVELVVANLKEEMKKAAEALDFEAAAKIRDKISAVEKVVIRQKVVSCKPVHQDVLGAVIEGPTSCIFLFLVRAGKIIATQTHFLEGEEGKEEILSSFIKLYYCRKEFIPKEILLGFPPADQALLEEWLSKKRGNKVKIKIPKIGDKLKLVKLAQRNASLILSQSQKKRPLNALGELKEVLGLKEIPERIEAVDISNLCGKEATGSLIVFVNGLAKKEEYRRFKIKTVKEPNDVAMIREVIRRRIKRLIKEEKGLPDLILVDGGRGQLNSAAGALEELGVKVPVIGLAKREELIYTLDRKEPIFLPREKAALKLLCAIRDEAHRFALSYHQKLRKKEMTNRKI